MVQEIVLRWSRGDLFFYMLRVLTPNDLIWHPAAPGVNCLAPKSWAVIGGHRGGLQVVGKGNWQAQCNG